MPLRSSGAPSLVSSQIDHFSSYTKLIFLFLATFHSCNVSSVSSLQGDSHRSRGDAGVPDSKQINQWKLLESLPTVLLLEVPVGKAFNNAASEQGGCGKAKARGHSEHHLFIPMFLFLFSGLNSAHTPTCAQHTLILISHIRQWKLLINPNCLFYPTDPGSGSGDDGKISPNLLSVKSKCAVFLMQFSAPNGSTDFCVYVTGVHWSRAHMSN